MPTQLRISFKGMRLIRIDEPHPRLKTMGLAWCTFQVPRRSHSTLMKTIKADPKLVSDQMGHTVDVN